MLWTKLLLPYLPMSSTNIPIGQCSFLVGRDDRVPNLIAPPIKLLLTAGGDVVTVMCNFPKIFFCGGGLRKSALHLQSLQKLVNTVDISRKSIVFNPKTVFALLDLVVELKEDARSLFCCDEQSQLDVLPAGRLRRLIVATDDRKPTYSGKINHRYLYVFTSGTGIRWLIPSYNILLLPIK